MYKPKYEVGKIYTDKKGNKLLITKNDPKEKYDRMVWYQDCETKTHFGLVEDEFGKMLEKNAKVEVKPEPEPTEADKNRVKAVYAKAQVLEKELEEKEKIDVAVKKATANKKK